MESLESLIDAIHNGDQISQGDLIPYLCVESKYDRFVSNLRLASAYLEAGNAHQAKVFISRAWLLSDFDQTVLPLYIAVHSRLNDVNALREVYKRVGINLAREKKIIEALSYFNKWQYVHATQSRTDSYIYDFDILYSIRQMAAPYKCGSRKTELRTDKIRIAYLMFGMTHENSVIVKISQIFARFHDKSQFEVTFFVPEQEHIIKGLKQALDSIESIIGFGCKVVVAPDCENEEQSLVKISELIESGNPDILVTNAALADMAHYFILSTRPAPIIIALLQGPPPQFVPPDIDWSIAWTKHPLMDCPTGCTLIPLEVEAPEPDRNIISGRSQLGIPSDVTVIVSAGRHSKFQDCNYWKAVNAILHKHDNVYLVVIGIAEDQLPSCCDQISQNIKSKIRLVEWSENYLAVLGVADIVLDTFPSGGGVVLLDAMFLSIPVVAFKNNYMKEFDQSEWSLGEELIDERELLAVHGDTEGLIKIVSKLVENKEFRVEMGKSCAAHTHLTRGTPARMVQKCEDVYLKQLEANIVSATNKCNMSQPDVIVQGQPIADRQCTLEYHINATLNGFYNLTETIHSDPPVVTRYEIPYLAPLNSYISRTGEPLSEEVILRSWLNGYSFPTEIHLTIPPRVAFTLKSSSVKGGGPIMVYRYAEWLSRLGVKVAIYSDDVPPEWLQLSATFHHYTYEVDRYTAITEPVVIVYSVMELPSLLKYCSTQGKRIYHLCQGIENFHYIPPQDKALATPVPIFDLLNALPIPRIAVSRHIEQFLQQHYGHQTFTIINGVDLDIFYPVAQKRDEDHVSALIFGNPEIPLKGVVSALVALAKVHAALPEREFHLDIVCGEDISARFESDFNHQGVSCSVHYRLEPQQIRDMFHAADLYINASYYEGFGLPSLEAMACGVPVVQVDNHGLDGIAFDGENCVIAPSQDPRDIAAAVLRVLSDAELRSRIVENGIATARRLSVQNQFAMFVEQFQRILDIQFEEQRIKEIMDKPLASRGVTPDNNEPEFTGWGRPLFTILIPTYNQAQYLPACLESLLAQTCPNWEAVIVNDGSTDSTREVLDHYARNDSRFRVFHKSNGGVATALNLALEHARGKWICWLSSDDMFMPDKLEIQVQAFASHPGIYFFHTNYNVFYEETGRLSAIELPADFVPSEELQVLKFLEINYFNGISIAVHRSVFEKVGGFNTSLRNGQDYDMWLRISARYRSRYIDRRTCITRLHPDQGSSLSADVGIFDSARSCLEFLNGHTFEELFPLLDLSQPEQGLYAIKNVLKILINPQAYINTCGYGAALLGRMREWLGQPENHQHLPFLTGQQFAAIVSNILASDLPPDLKEAFGEFHSSIGKPYHYRPVAVLDVLTRHVQYLEKTPGMAQEARSLRHYLSKNMGVVATVEQPESNVPYWQKMQEAGYFENHDCYGREHNGLVLFGNDDQTIRDYTPLTPDMNVVVIGCGYGRESTLIAPHVKHVYGIDVSDLILDKARAFTASHGIDNFTAVHAERWQDEIPGGIDLVYTMVVFQHLTRALVREYISGLARKLTPGGRFLCQFCESSQGSYNAELKTHEPNVSWTADEIRDLIHSQGLQLYRLDSGQVTEDAAWHWALFGH